MLYAIFISIISRQAAGIEQDDAIFEKYSYAWYWAVVTLFTTGYGDITAHNTAKSLVHSFTRLLFM